MQQASFEARPLGTAESAESSLPIYVHRRLTDHNGDDDDDANVPTVSSAAPTSAPSSPSSLYILAAIGTCSLPYTFIDSAAACNDAAVSLSLADTSSSAPQIGQSTAKPYGCFFRQSNAKLFFNPDGITTSTSTVLVSVCKLSTSAPTISPTNVANTYSPTAAPTVSPAAPSAAPTISPTNVGDTYSPTAAPTVSTAAPSAAPTISPTNVGDNYSPTVAPTSPAYVMATVGTCSSPYTFIDSAAACNDAAVILSLADTSSSATQIGQSTAKPYGCYFRQTTAQLYFNPDGITTSTSTALVSICKLSTSAPTVSPANMANTYSPTAAPTVSSAAPTSAPSSPLSLYILAAIGTCSLPYTFIDSAAACNDAAVSLSLAGTSSSPAGDAEAQLPYGCLFRPSNAKLFFNPDGITTSTSTVCLSLCKLTTTAPTPAPSPVPTAPSPAPTATPTNIGDTHTPTVSPTAAPTAGAPSNWNPQLESRCASSACDTANGGCTIILSDDFVMGSYSGKIDFSGKAITIWGQGNVLDASGGGRLFPGVGAGSFLELHDTILQNGNAVNVSGWSASRHCVLELFWEPPLTFRSNSWRGTCNF
jgi:hypothetical protein